MIFHPLPSGKSVQGIDIPAFKSDINSDRYLYLIGGTHGDEVEGVYVLKELFEWLKSEHSIEDLPIIVVPILNVDGYRDGTRVNSHAVDLNRNLPAKNWTQKARKPKYNPGASAGSEPENAFLMSLFEKYSPELILSFHSWKPLLNYSPNAKEVAEHLHKFNQYELCEDIGYPTPGSLGTYAPEKYNSGVLTFECPLLETGISLKKIWEENQAGLKSIFTENILKNKIK